MLEQREFECSAVFCMQLQMKKAHSTFFIPTGEL
jgi:hypothetical protein